jgi:hypothetical protein
VVIETTDQRRPVRKTRKELLSDWHQQEILLAARQIFARVGYAATNVEEIAKDVCTSNPKRRYSPPSLPAIWSV